jgi:hypothetical protein
MTVVAGFETCGWGASRMVNRRERDLDTTTLSRCSLTRSSSIRITLLSAVPLLSSSMVAPYLWLG